MRGPYSHSYGRKAGWMLSDVVGVVNMHFSFYDFQVRTWFWNWFVLVAFQVIWEGPELFTGTDVNIGRVSSNCKILVTFPETNIDQKTHIKLASVTVEIRVNFEGNQTNCLVWSVCDIPCMSVFFMVCLFVSVCALDPRVLVTRAVGFVT